MIKKSSKKIESYSIKDLNQLIIEKKFNQAVEVLIFYLKKIEWGNDLISVSKIGQEQTDIDVQNSYSHLATAIINLMISKDFIMTQKIFFALIVFKRNIEIIFQLSTFSTSDVVLEFANIVNTKTGKLEFKNESDFHKLLLCLGLNSAIDIDYRFLLPQGKTAVLATYLAQLSNIIFLNELSFKKYVSLLNQMDIIDTINYLDHPVFVELLSSIWMSCSYQNLSNKHLIKSKLNKIIQRTWAQWGTNDIKQKLDSKISSEKPTLLIIADVFSSYHAMFRTFSRVFLELAKEYNLVLMVEKDKIDKTAKKIFSNTIEIPTNNYQFLPIIKKIKSINPSVIFYPSLGMSNLGLWLANLRLAPIQVAGLGHPASSFIEHIDFLLMEESLYHPMAEISEKIILLPMGSHEYSIHPDFSNFPKKKINNGNVINIAIPCNLHKITLEFLSLCKEIQTTSSKEIHFHFFPNIIGTHWYLTKKQIQQILPSSTIHKRTSYDKYLELLAECDFALSTFPFGGYNSTLEALELGLPVITLEGVEPHEKTDSYLLRYLNADKRLITLDKSSYLKIALDIIEDNTLLSTLSDNVKNLAFDNLIKTGEINDQNIFCNLFKILHEKGLVLSESNQKILPYLSLFLQEKAI